MGRDEVQLEAAELVGSDVRDIANLRHRGAVQHGLRDFQPQRRVDVVDVQQIRFGADERNQRHHQLFAYGVDGRVGNLREQLAEIVVEGRSEEHTSELQSLMRISYAVFCLKKKRK